MVTQSAASSRFIAGPPRWPAPDYGGIGTVTRVWVPDDETVGWLVIQDEARLAWFSAIGQDSLGYPIRLHVGELLAKYLADGRTARKLFDEVLRVTLHTAPNDEYLPALMADIRRLWKG